MKHESCCKMFINNDLLLSLTKNRTRVAELKQNKNVLFSLY